jgi:hypothetical protein
MDRRAFLQKGIMAGVAASANPGLTQVASADPVLATQRDSNTHSDETSIVIENAEFRFTIGTDGIARSLTHKRSGQECLDPAAAAPVFWMKQYQSLPGQFKLAYRMEAKVFPAQSVRREGDRLIVAFAAIPHEATIRLKVTDAYVAFQVENVGYRQQGFRKVDLADKTPIDEMVFLQIPARNRKNFGDWLNVMWDDEVAVNVLAADPWARITHEPRKGYQLLQAGTENEIRTEGVTAALIVTGTGTLLDRIATLEEDFDLPRGVESRRRPECKYSYYEILSGSPGNIDRHIHFAQEGGFRTVQVYYRAFAKTAGHFAWRPEYPNGMADLQGVVGKISSAGMIPGVHIHYNKADRTDEYVTPKPDPRLNLRHTFTLTAPLDAARTTVEVAENPRLCTMDNERRVLRIQDELVEYDRYTTTPPYQFTGCKRGALGTQPAPHQSGTGLGLLDVDSWPLFVRFNQDTTLQEEVALRWGNIYRAAGFKFTYFDGAEDVPPPFWFMVPWAQWQVYKQLEPKPLFSEGAARSHFSWHMLSRANAFDVFRPEEIRSAIRQFPAQEAPRVARDFTLIDFGWMGYWVPNAKTIGTQPDMLEYATSRAAAWDCPAALDGNLKDLEAHPRTPDNLEVLRRWEEVRLKGWLTPAQKESLRNLEQEHILLINEQGNFELVPYAQVKGAGGGDRRLRAFVFERKERTCAVYWHTSGNASVDLPLPANRMKLMEKLGRSMAIHSTGTGVRLPLANRRFVEFTGLSQEQVTSAFQRAKVAS